MKRILILSIILYCILAYNNCDTTSYIWYGVGDTLGLDVEVCCANLSSTEEFDHAWIRLYGYNVETSTLNLIKSPFCDYNTPYFVSSNRTLIELELFV